MTNRFFNDPFVAIKFRNELSAHEKRALTQNPNELYCTAIAKSVKQSRPIIVDIRRHQCAGGNYFVGGQKCPFNEICNIYIYKEKIFKNKRAVRKLLHQAGQNPLKYNYIIMTPIHPITQSKSQHDSPDAIFTLTTPDIASRIIGIANYHTYTPAQIIPAASTCTSLFQPLLKPHKIHVNLIDYFDRDYQCKGLFPPQQLLLSMSAKIFNNLINNYQKSSHGNNKPTKMKIYKA